MIQASDPTFIQNWNYRTQLASMTRARYLRLAQAERSQDSWD